MALDLRGHQTSLLRHAAAAITVVASGVMLAACAGAGLETTALQSSGVGATLSLPSLPKIELPSGPPPNVGTPIEVYGRIGRGLRQCWLGPDRPLNAGYLYEASTEPAHKGGRSEIVIRERETNGPSTRGSRAFTILISPDPSHSDQSVVEVQNAKLPQAQAADIERQVKGWATGALGCDDGSAKAAWQPQQETGAKPAADTKPSRRSKSKSKTTTASAQDGKGI